MGYVRYTGVLHCTSVTARALIPSVPLLQISVNVETNFDFINCKKYFSCDYV